jgi:hypothetical protein
MAAVVCDLKMRSYELNMKRGLIAGLAAATLAFAVPWLLMYLLLFAKWVWNDTSAWDRQYDVNLMSGSAWMASYFLASIFGTVAWVSFGTNPRRTGAGDFGVVAITALTTSALAFFVDLIVYGQRLKGEPSVGEKPIDIFFLTVPAVATGILILAWRTLRRSRNG